MIVVRNTSKVAKELGLKKADIIETEEEGYLGSWFCNLVVIDRGKCLIFCHSATLYCFIVPYITKKMLVNFMQIFKDNLASNLQYEGFTSVVVRKLLDEYHEVLFSKTNSRSVLGSMNDYRYMCEVLVALNEGLANCDILKINKTLNETPMSGIGYSCGIKEMKRQLSNLI